MTDTAAARPAADRPRRRSPRSAWVGPAPAWPRVVDALAEGWWRLPVRLRLALVAVVVACAVLGLVRRSSQSPWGRPVDVVVARLAAAPGDELQAVPTSWPADLVPKDALAVVDGGLVATRSVRAGEVLTTAHVATDLSDLVHPGEVAIALAQELPDLPAGADLVVLGAGFDGQGRTLATGRLVARTPEWTWVAVPTSSGPAVAAAVATGQVTVALSGVP